MDKNITSSFASSLISESSENMTDITNYGIIKDSILNRLNVLNSFGDKIDQINFDGTWYSKSPTEDPKDICAKGANKYPNVIHVKKPETKKDPKDVKKLTGSN